MRDKIIEAIENGHKTQNRIANYIGGDKATVIAALKDAVEEKLLSVVNDPIRGLTYSVVPSDNSFRDSDKEALHVPQPTPELIAGIDPISPGSYSVGDVAELNALSGTATVTKESAEAASAAAGIPEPPVEESKDVQPTLEEAKEAVEKFDAPPKSQVKEPINVTKDASKPIIAPPVAKPPITKPLIKADGRD